jgi:hypothetical protein
MRSLPRGTLNAIKRGLVVLLTFLVINFYWKDHYPSGSSTVSGFESSLNGRDGEGHGGLPYPLPRTRLLRNSIPLTQILNHAPGYTVFRDLYFHKGIYLILTDSPHEIPKNLDHIAFIENRPVEVPKPVQMLEVRREPIIGNFPKGMIHDAFITPEEAVKRFDVGKVEVVKGISVSGFLPTLLDCAGWFSSSDDWVACTDLLSFLLWWQFVNNDKKCKPRQCGARFRDWV